MPRKGKRGIDTCWDCRQNLTSVKGGVYIHGIYNKQPMLYSYLPWGHRGDGEQMVYICPKCHEKRINEKESI
jgi:hypothetical protein